MIQYEEKWEDTEKESIWFSIREIAGTGIAGNGEDWDSIRAQNLPRAAPLHLIANAYKV